MTILFVSHVSDCVGGASFALIDMIQSLKEDKGINSVVLLPSEYGGLADELKKQKINYIVHKYGCWAFVKSGHIIYDILRFVKLFYWQAYALVTMKQLIKKVSKYNIDIVHSNTSVVNIGALIAKFMNKKHIWHVREFGEEHQNFQYIFGEKYTRKVMEKFSDKIVTISEALKNKYLKYVDINNVITIYDGVSNRYINPKKRVKKSKEFNMLITGTIQKGKGQLQAVEACNKLIINKCRVKLTIAGECADLEYLLSIKKYIEKNSMENNINMVGKVENMNELRSKMDLELVCSYMEGFGRVTVEAMLSMLPVVASDSGANIEIVKNSVNGYVYKFNCVDDLYQKIYSLYLDRTLCQKMGENGYQIAINNYIQKYNTSKIIELYNNILL